MVIFFVSMSTFFKGFLLDEFHFEFKLSYLIANHLNPFPYISTGNILNFPKTYLISYVFSNLRCVSCLVPSSLAYAVLSCTR